MKIQDQVCSLSQGKQLAALGIITKSYFMWQDTCNPDEYAAKEMVVVFDKESYDKIGIAPAFTTAELGVMLPDNHFAIRSIIDSASRWEYFHKRSLVPVPLGHFPNEAQARAEILLFLLETNMITVDEINSRLIQ